MNVVSDQQAEVQFLEACGVKKSTFSWLCKDDVDTVEVNFSTDFEVSSHNGLVWTISINLINKLYDQSKKHYCWCWNIRNSTQRHCKLEKLWNVYQKHKLILNKSDILSLIPVGAKLLSCYYFLAIFRRFDLQNIWIAVVTAVQLLFRKWLKIH